MMLKKKCISFFCITIMSLFITLLFSTVTFASNHHNHHNTVVKTDYGFLKGYVADDVLVWKGVPYAKPPVGDLRWKAPEAPARWHGIRDASQPALKCTQLETSIDWLRSGVVDPNSGEDCLYLDVFRSKSSEKLPVYVFIHGGANNYGSAREYSAATLAAKSDVVAVVIQYRLGPMGWMFHPALQGGTDALSNSGNFGTLDTAQALKWVKENIEAFGGDPHKITVTGESAGAHNTMNLVISPVAKGLFNRAMYESGGMQTVSTTAARTSANGYIESLIRYKENVDAATATARRVAMEGDGTLKSYLSSASSADFFMGILKTGVPNFPAIEDGNVIPVGGWMPAIKSGNYNKMPIILGCNEYEMKVFLPLFYSYASWLTPSTVPTYTWYSLFTSVRNNNTPRYEDILPQWYDKEVYDRVGYFGSRQWKAKNVDSLARAFAEQQDDVYAYYFKWGGVGSGPYPFDNIYGASHAAEIPFFGISDDKGLFNLPWVAENEKGRTELQAGMMSYLANFARTGNPNAGHSWGHRKGHHHAYKHFPKWDKWSNAAGDPKSIIFDADFNQANIAMMNEEVTHASAEAERQAWLSNLLQIGADPTWVYYVGVLTTYFLWQPAW